MKAAARIAVQHLIDNVPCLLAREGGRELQG